MWRTNMRHLIAKRDRLRDMIAEQEADLWLIYSQDELQGVLSLENQAFLRLESEQRAELRQRESQARGLSGWASQDEKVRSVADRLHTCRVEGQSAIDAIEAWTKRINEAIGKLRFYRRRKEELFATAMRLWEALDERERRFFTKPIPYPQSVLDMPKPWVSELGDFYPERMTVQEAQLGKLRHALLVVEDELGGEA
jgi:hypothetical protein